jgi:hypothetical protein
MVVGPEMTAFDQESKASDFAEASTRENIVEEAVRDPSLLDVILFDTGMKGR